MKGQNKSCQNYDHCVPHNLFFVPLLFSHLLFFVHSGDLSVDSRDFPPRPEWEKDWSAATGVKLLSAYKEVDGKEPNFTNNAKVRFFVMMAESWTGFFLRLSLLFSCSSCNRWCSYFFSPPFFSSFSFLFFFLSTFPPPSQVSRG